MSLPRLAAGLERFLDLLLAPGLCVDCGCELAAPGSLCRACAEDLPQISNACRVCGQSSPTAADICPACLINPPRWQTLIAPFAYQPPVSEWLRRFKYDGALHYARTLCEASQPLLQAQQPLPEVLLPVPLHETRLRERGFNQAGVIAGLIGATLEIPVDTRFLRRTRATASQSGLSAAQRKVAKSSASMLHPLVAIVLLAVALFIPSSGFGSSTITSTIYCGSSIGNAARKALNRTLDE